MGFKSLGSPLRPYPLPKTNAAGNNQNKIIQIKGRNGEGLLNSLGFSEPLKKEKNNPLPTLLRLPSAPFLLHCGT